MDFELLSETPEKPATALDLFERMLTNRPRQWQIWGEHPPYILGFCLLLTSALEMVLSSRLFHNSGGGREVIRHIFGTALLLLMAEVFVLMIATKGAEFVGKKGNFVAGLTYLNMSLSPFLLILPITLACWLVGGPSAGAFRTLAYFVLGLKVLSSWKESVEFTFKFSKVQSGLVMYASMVVAAVLAGLVVYIEIIRSIHNAFY